MLKIGNKDGVDDPTKMRYFDPIKNREVYMERCSEILFAKIVRVAQPPDWYDMCESSPSKQKV